MAERSTRNQVGTFVVSSRIWENQSELLRPRFWTRILKVMWDEQRYWITAESALFDGLKPGEVIPDYDITVMRHRGRKDSVTATRQRIAIAA